VTGKRSTTIVDVARKAGVSTATAGRVLGGYGYSSEEKRTRVLQAAEELGYSPNQLARSLITGRTRTIGFVAGDIQSPFYAKILRGISDSAGRLGFGVLITNSDETVEEEVRAIGLLREKQVDGLIVSPCDTIAAPHLREVARSTPLVLIDREVQALEVDTVGVDNVAAARDCIATTIRAGHRRIGIIAELQSSFPDGIESFVEAARSGTLSDHAPLYPSWQRLLGYLRAHEDAGLPVDLSLIARVGSYSAEAAERQALALLTQENRPTALFTADGVMTASAMSAITSCRLRIPDDLSLVAFDDLDWMSFVSPGINAVAQPRRAMGEAAARMLMERIDGFDGPPRHLKLAPRQTTRGSLAPHG
jgi:LacI family transcriptional regulator